MIKTAFHTVSSLVFPKVCETCQAVLPVRDRWGVCTACRAKILKISPPFCPACGRTSVYKHTRCGQCRDGHFHFDHVYAASYYEGTLRELLHAFKFNGRKSLLPFLSGILEEFILNHLDIRAVDALVSVPMSSPKENERGFNQAGLLSRSLAKKLKKEDLSPFFKKKKSAQIQSRLNKQERLRNISASFFVTNPAAFAGKNILLVDDILTTGFTASECAKTLKNAGASSVTALAVARGL